MPSPCAYTSISAALALALAGCSGGSPEGSGSTSDDGASEASSAAASTSDPTTGGSASASATGSTGSASADPTTGDPTTGPTTGDPTTGGPTSGDPTTGDPTTGDPTTGDPTTGGVVCPGGDLGPGDHTVKLTFGGASRSYLLHVPPSYDADAATPLIVNFHGYTSNAGQQVLFSQMNSTADAEGFIVAYPEGIQNSWNAGECCGGAQSMGLDDVGFARAVVEDIQGALCVDPARIYATGMSNGGFMTNRLACEASDLFAAFAPVSAVLVKIPCAPARPVPIMMFNGTTDTLVPYGGGLFLSAVETFAAGAATCATYQECDEGAEVTLCTIDPMGHCWPGNAFCPLPPANTDISANDAMWEFFQAHPMP